MRHNPILDKLACVALVACLILPFGRMLAPHIADTIGGMPLSAIEAVVSATLGFGLYIVLFG